MDKLKNFETGIMPGPITFSPGDHIGVKQGKMITLIGNKEAVVASYPTQ
jgi:branched-chain amino acid transport system substrate-binding protein